MTFIVLQLKLNSINIREYTFYIAALLRVISLKKLPYEVAHSVTYVQYIYLRFMSNPYSRGCILVVNKLALEVVGHEFEPRLSQDLK